MLTCRCHERVSTLESFDFSSQTQFSINIPYQTLTMSEKEKPKPKPMGGGLVLYPELLKTTASSDSTISSAPVIYKQPEAASDAQTAAKKLNTGIS